MINGLRTARVPQWSRIMHMAGPRGASRPVRTRVAQTSTPETDAGPQEPAKGEDAVAQEAFMGLRVDGRAAAQLKRAGGERNTARR